MAPRLGLAEQALAGMTYRPTEFSCMYHSVPGKRPCTAFQGATVAASIYTNLWNFDPG